MARNSRNNILRMKLLYLFALLVSPLCAWGDEDARFWLDKMTQAVQSLNYEGTFVYMHGDRVETMRIVHGFDNGNVRERLVSLTGEAREVIRDQDVLTCVWPKSKFVVVETSRTRHGIPATTPADSEALKAFYDFRIAGEDRIAGKLCKLIDILPKDKYRYGYRLCVAEESGMLLKSAMMDTNDKPIEQVMFTSLALHDEIPLQNFESKLNREGFTWHTVASKDKRQNLQSDQAWKINDMPPGFAVTEQSKRQIAASSQPVQHIILTDGLASVSVFIARPDNRSELYKGMTRSGALNAYARDFNGHQVTVVGEVPRITVEMIGESIEHNP